MFYQQEYFASELQPHRLNKHYRKYSMQAK